jgi:multidrug resistance efflux pump
MKIRRIIIPIVFVVAVVVGAYWYFTTQNLPATIRELTGTGTVEANEATISSEVSGRITDVFMDEGDRVSVGDPLFTLDSMLLDGQHKQAQANLNAAQVGMEVAQNSFSAALAGEEIAQAQYDLTLIQALQQAQPVRSSVWSQKVPAGIDLPGWYYTRAEQNAAALEELNSTKIGLEDEMASFNKLMSTGNFAKLADTETRLAQAELAFMDAADVLDRSNLQDDQVLIDFAQNAFDAAKDELEAAKDAYDKILSTQETNDLLDARAKLALAQERYDTAQDRYNSLLVGRDSLQVRLAAATLTQSQNNVALAQSRVSQAQTAIDQAQAALDLINIQLKKLIIAAPLAGKVLARNIEPGEVIQAGASALTLGDLDNLTITVYIPENRYGEVSLGDKAQVIVDSFPDQSFIGTVTRIANKAEFTPRNVQTTEGRSSTVYAIQLEVEDPNGLLIPGMPADVTFTLP